MSRRISIFGLGYVGSVTAACLASKGHHVIGVDPNPIKVDALHTGRTPIVEAGMDEMIAAAHKGGRISATTDPKDALLKTDISFISVGTPSQRNGKLDLSHIYTVSKEIGEALREKTSFHWIVLRSTVLPGTTESEVIPAIEASSGKKAGRDFSVCFNPEFLREGSAVQDFNKPPFTIIGSGASEDVSPIRELYEWAPAAIHETTIRTAEMVKYVCNAFHALKISFANEIGTLCAEIGIDPLKVAEIYTSDTHLNISKAYLKPGFAFGGSCLPKDLRALNYKAKELDLRLPLLQSILPSNQEHIDRAIESVLQLGKKRIGVLGLSFKSGTDDLRESPMVMVVKRLLGEGCHIQIWDEKVSLGQLIGSNQQFIQETIPHIGELLQPNLQEVVHNSDVLLLGTHIDLDAIPIRNSQIVFDLLHLTAKGREHIMTAAK